MRITPHLTGSILMLFACVLSAGCGSTHHGNHSPPADQNQPAASLPATQQNNNPPGAPGAPGAAGGSGNGNGRAPAAPIKVPAIIQIQGAPMYGPGGAFELFMYGGPDPGAAGSPVEGIVQQCGGTKCVTVVVKANPSDTDRTLCQFSEVSPNGGTSVPRSMDTVIVLYTGSSPCTQSPDSGGNGGQSATPGDNSGQSPDASPPA